MKGITNNCIYSECKILNLLLGSSPLNDLYITIRLNLLKAVSSVLDDKELFYSEQIDNECLEIIKKHYYALIEITINLMCLSDYMPYVNLMLSLQELFCKVYAIANSRPCIYSVIH